MGRWCCSRCFRKMESNKKRYHTSAPVLWEHYRREVGEAASRNDVICQRCEANIRYSFGCMPAQKQKSSSCESFHHNHQKRARVMLESEGMEVDQSLDEERLPSAQDVENILEASFRSAESSEVILGRGFQDSLEILSDSDRIFSEQHSSMGSLGTSTVRGVNTVTVVGMKTAAKTESRCFLCQSSEGRCVISKKAITDAYIRTKIRIPVGNRCCQYHFQDGLLTLDALAHLVAYKENSDMSQDEVSSWITTLTNEATEKKPRIDFDSSGLTDEDYELLIGFPKRVFDDIVTHCGSIRNSINRSKRNAIAMLLMQLRLNLTLKQLCFLFRIDNLSTVSETLDSVLTALEAEGGFVSKNIGFKHSTRSQLIQDHSVKSNTKLLQANADPEEEQPVTDDVLKLVFDCTYLYIQKPSDFTLQKRTYCMHKHWNLVKPMMIVTETGYIVEAAGPYYSDAKNNDAAIFKRMLEDGDILDFFEVGDRAIFDRGFRDVIEYTEDHAIHTHMPCLLSKSKKQFDVEDANNSRQVTMVRWIVEAVNGRVKKKFKFFDSVIENSYLPKLGRLFRLACALINCYCKPIFSESEAHEKLVDQAISAMNKPNKLYEQLVSDGSINSRKIWRESTEEEEDDFPSLTEEDIKAITLGGYQIKMGKLYIVNQLSHGEHFQLFVHSQNQCLMKVNLQSRFSRAVRHNIWIQIQPKGRGQTSITGRYCSCMSGRRTMGTCSHVTAALWYFGHARKHPEAIPKRKNLVSGILDAAAEIDANMEEECNS